MSTENFLTRLVPSNQTQHAATQSPDGESNIPLDYTGMDSMQMQKLTPR
jgi:hypothetical protein